MPKGQVKDMYYEQELLFLKDTLRRCGVQVGFTDEEGLPQRYWQTGPYSLMVDESAFAAGFSQTMPAIEPATVYSLTDDFSCHYLYFALPEPGLGTLVTIGPYLNEAVTPERIMEAAEKEGVASAVAQQLIKYYYSVPTIPKTSHLFVMLDAFFERLWGANGYTMEHLSRRLPADLPMPDAASAQTPQSRLRQMEMMEMRYAMENALMDAIAGGQYHKIEVQFSQFSARNFERRVSDNLRNTKNYCIITNTLFRKAAEKGGVHPYYLDEASSEFANRIEQLSSQSQVASLMLDMAKTYCRLVRKSNIRDYSALVQKAVLCIEGELAGNLSLRVLAENLNVNASYLSDLFKKETGQTVTEFITGRRMELAKQLLKDTKLQVQTVAQHCGIVDVHYFTKLFKRHTGRTPREYRQS